MQILFICIRWSKLKASLSSWQTLLCLKGGPSRGTNSFDHTWLFNSQIKLIWNLICMGLRTLEWHKRGGLPLELVKHFTFAIRLERAQNRASHRMALTHKTLTFTSAKLPADSVNITSGRNASLNPILSHWKLFVLFYNERDLNMQPNNQSEGSELQQDWSLLYIPELIIFRFWALPDVCSHTMYTRWLWVSCKEEIETVWKTWLSHLAWKYSQPSNNFSAAVYCFNKLF